MDELMNSFNSFVTSDDTCSHSNLASNVHPRLVEYKKKTLSSNQETRRRQILDEQKRKRQQLVEQTRHVSKNEVKSSPSKKSAYRKAPYNLMFSEWLEEVPHDFESNWIMCLCPVGKRCLVVASEGSTIVYNKAGKIISKHRSSLPGGNSESKIDWTVLDCIYNDALRTYHVLDCLCWKSHPILDTETEFRFYWLKCKLEETPKVGGISMDNPYKFADIPRYYGCTKETMETAMATNFPIQVDGVLFYHKETHYTCDYTPLVGWLRPYMLPEILGVAVPQSILDKAPSDYNSARDAIFASNIEIERLKSYLSSKATVSSSDESSLAPSSIASLSPVSQSASSMDVNDENKVYVVKGDEIEQ